MAKRIEKLTPEQAKRMPEFRDAWLNAGLSTERADRQRAQAGVKLAYEAAGLKPPTLIIWLDSPMAGAIGATLLSNTPKAGAKVRDQVCDQVCDQVRGQVCDQVGGQVRGQVWDQVRGQVWGQVWDQVRGQVWDQVGGQVGGQVWDQVGGQVGGQVWDQVRGQVWDQVWDQVRGQVGRAVYGQHDAGWLAFYDFFATACGLESAKRLHGLNEVAQSSGWWWPFEHAVILTERPTEIHRNAEHRLHNDGGPALLYPDGFGIWALNGLRVAQRIVEQPETLTAIEVRDEANAEVRRHMLDRYAGQRGSAAQGRWLQDIGAKPISSVDITDKLQPSALTMWKLSNGEDPCLCRLYRADVSGDEPLVLLWVVCTSTLKEVFLRVPPTMLDAEKARDWTFGDVRLAQAVET
jgi:hypothetical protein